MLEPQRRIPVATITQKQLFVWKDLEILGDLERLQLALDYLPDENVMELLENERGNGRDDYPIRCVWNSIIAGIIYEHKSIESLRRELNRNGQLRQMCGFNILKGLKAIPPSWAYTRFLKKLLKYEDQITKMFDLLVKEIKKCLPDFGRYLAFDGKAIQSVAPGKKKYLEDVGIDGRRELDADWGKKVYKGQNQDGSLWEKVKSWFGFRLHLIVDAKYELPVAFKVTKASSAEGPVIHELFDELEEKRTDILDTCEYGLGDRGYDDGKLIKRLWDEYNIKPVIDIRNMWRDKETKILDAYWNIGYNYKGNVFCFSRESRELIQREMAFGGFEKDRNALKYRCPAKHYGFECRECKCSVKNAIRIPLETNRRIFTPLARSGYSWKRIYKMRTSVERINSRLDVSFGFENHYIRGIKKMNARCGLSLCIMLSMALGRIKENQDDLIRSLVKSA
jgi:hypothetical protein